MATLNSVQQDLAEQYSAAFHDFLRGAGEAALERAYAIARRGIAEGLGVLDLAAAYQESLAASLRDAGTPEEFQAVSRAAAEFFSECLSPYEMTYRSFRETMQELKASEHRYRELVENANDVIFTLDLQGNITSVNRAGEQLTGYRLDENPQMNIAELVAPECRALAQEMMQHKLAGRGATTYKLEVLAKDGNRVPLEVSTRLILNNGVPVGVQGIARDITERKRAENAIRSLNEALEQQAKRIAHALHDESGQLLASVHIALSEAAEGLPADARKRLQRAIGHLDQIEEQLRRFSHELRPTVLDDLGLVAALEFLTRGASKRTGIPVSLQGPKNHRFPAQVETTLYRIVQEALNNIARHSKAKRASVQVETEGDVLRCVIQDNGKGFKPETVLARKGHRGLGLIGIRGRLEALGGRFEIRAAPKKGTQLCIMIPLEEGNATTHPTG